MESFGKVEIDSSQMIFGQQPEKKTAIVEPVQESEQIESNNKALDVVDSDENTLAKNHHDARLRPDAPPFAPDRVAAAHEDFVSVDLAGAVEEMPHVEKGPKEGLKPFSITTSQKKPIPVEAESTRQEQDSVVYVSTTEPIAPQEAPARARIFTGQFLKKNRVHIAMIASSVITSVLLLLYVVL